MFVRMKTCRIRLQLVILLPFLLPSRTAFEPLTSKSIARSVQGILISQVYGAGGNSGAAWRNDFVELFNSGPDAVDLKGWSIQYSPATGSSWQKTDLSGIIQPGRHYLIEEGSGGQSGAQLPIPDIVGTINASASGGKVALLNSTSLIPGGSSCPGPGTVDLLGYGASANCSEGSPAAAPTSNASSLIRRAGGCQDTNDNKSDFSVSAASPHNSATPALSCTPSSDPLVATGLASPSIVTTGQDLLLTVTVGPASTPPSTGISVVADLTQIGGRSEETLFDDATHGDATAGDLIFSLRTIAVVSSAGPRTLIAKITDQQGRSTETTIRALINQDLTPASDQSAGSVLVFSLYRSVASNPQAEETLLSLTNTDEQRPATVHLFLVNGAAGDVTDSFTCLPPAGTSIMLASQTDPGISGFMVAVAVDSSTGCPVRFNQLMGQASVRLASRHSADLSALAFSGIFDPPCECNANSTSTEIRLNGLNYQVAPRVLAVSSLSPGLSAMLVIDRLGGSFLGSSNTIGQIAGNIYNDEERVLSFEFSSSRRQFVSALSDSFPRTTPPVSQAISLGHTGWLKLWTTADVPLVGSLLTSNGGRHLHVLTVTDTSSIVIPVSPPAC
jgi:hypothetical protein